MARLFVSDPTGTCEVDLLKEAIGPPTLLSIGPVLAFDDAVGLKVRALFDRAAHRDFVDVHAAGSRRTWREMERLGAQHTAAFSLEELADRLGAISELDERTFAHYGLDEKGIATLRRWAAAWEADLRMRVAVGEAGPIGPSDSDDEYLDE